VVYIPIAIIVNQHNISTLSSPINGGITTGQGKFNENKSCTVTATANFGYSFLNWTENNLVVSTNPTYEFVVLSERNLVANFICNPATKPVPISGQSVVCRGESNVIYSVSGTENATSYQWTLPNGATGTSNTNSIAVDFPNAAASGLISVAIGNECVQNIESTLAVEVTNAPEAPTITLLNGVLHSSLPIGTQWYVNGSPINGATNQELTTNIIGTYFVKASTGNCFSEPSNSIYFNQFTSGNSEPVRVYPNPTTGKTTILFAEHTKGNLKIQLYNYQGSLISEEEIEATTNVYAVDLSNYEAGIYLLRINKNGKTFTMKVLKE